MVYSAWPALVSLEFFQPGYWDYHRQAFHGLAMLYGTLLVSLLAVTFATPLGLGAAIYASEYLFGAPRVLSKVLIEMLAAIPSVVYGLFGVAFLTQGFQDPLIELGGSSGNSLLTAATLLAIMIIPNLMTFCDDALRCVPNRVRDAGLSLGMTKAQTISHLVLPYAKKGIVGSIFLSLGRALGETIAVFLVIGRADLLFNPSAFSLKSLIEAGQTITTKLGGSELPIAYGDSVHWSSLMALGVVLWGVVLLLNTLSRRVMI